VWVDGTQIEVSDGGVPLSGALGSVHTVKISADGVTTTSEVAITDEGPRPAQIALPLHTHGKAGSASRPKASVRAPTPPAASAAQAPPDAKSAKPKPVLERTFE
jgi:hypothetical protein